METKIGLFTFKEVCEQLSISISTLNRLLAKKEIDGYMVGSQWRFSKEQIDAYLERNKRANENQATDN
jgi:excisionase family DNA binding protein